MMTLQIFGTHKCPDTRKAERFFKDRGLAYMDFDAEEEILADPLLLRTPVVRVGARAVAGHDPAGWASLADEGRS